MPSELITIVIVNYKTAALSCQAVQYAKDHAAAESIAVHIAVVDNGSGDGSVQAIRSAHPDITVIDSGANLGFSAGNNLILRDVKTPYVMLLNSDAFIQAGMLRRLVDVLDRNPNIGAIGPRILNPDGTDQDYPCRFPTIPEMMRRAVRGPQFPAQGRDAAQLIPIDRIHGCCLMTRRSVLEQVGILDEQFFMYDEDMDWCLRCRKAGWILCLVPNAAVIHLGGQTSGRAPSGRRQAKTLRAFNTRMSYELRKSRYILYRKHCSFFEVIALKIFTDMTLAAGCILALPGLMKQESREHARARLRLNASIMAINPFGLKVRV